MAVNLLITQVKWIPALLKLQQNTRISLMSTSQKKSIYKNEESKKIRFLTRYLQYVKSYSVILEKKFPKAMTLYNTFMDGVKYFYADTKEFLKIVKIISAPGNGLHSLTRKEIELYTTMPKDMMKVAPILLLSTLPFANYVIFPLIYMFPRQLLTSHFLTKEQRAKFQMETLQTQISTHKVILQQLSCPGLSQSHKKYELWTKMLSQIKNGKQVLPLEIMYHKDIFMNKPFHLIYLKRRHIRYLLTLHNLHCGWFRRRRLANKAKILRAMDYAIIMEGGVHNLPPHALRNACIIRGLNPDHLSEANMVEWLRKWMTISNAVDNTCLSLLLHAPLLLGKPSKRELKMS